MKKWMRDSKISRMTRNCLIMKRMLTRRNRKKKSTRRTSIKTYSKMIKFKQLKIRIRVTSKQT